MSCSNKLRKVTIKPPDRHYETSPVEDPKCGYFHKFIQTSNSTQGIVELEDGSVVAVSINFIKFNEPPPQN